LIFKVYFHKERISEIEIRGEQGLKHGEEKNKKGKDE
jgi:hypothetical protein